MNEDTRIWVRILERTANFFASLLKKWREGKIEDI